MPFTRGLQREVIKASNTRWVHSWARCSPDPEETMIEVPSPGARSRERLLQESILELGPKEGPRQQEATGTPEGRATARVRY